MKGREGGGKKRATKESKAPSSKESKAPSSKESKAPSSKESKAPSSRSGGKSKRPSGGTVDGPLKIERAAPDDPEAFQALCDALGEVHPGAVAGVGAGGDTLTIFLARPIPKAVADQMSELVLEHDYSTRTDEQRRIAQEKADLVAFRERLADLVDENAQDLRDVASGAATAKQTFARILNREAKLLRMLRRILTIVKED